MRILGLDLAVRAKHQAIIADEGGRFISPVIKFETRLADLESLRARACKGADSDETLVVVMEATGIVWYALSVYFARHQATVYVVNPRLAADPARFYKRHARSDRLAAQVLARLPIVSPDSLYPLVLSGGDYLALQRGCKELERLTTQASALKNRIQATDHLGWPGLKKRVFGNAFSPAARWFRDNFYDPCQVVAAGVERLDRAWRATEWADKGDEAWIEPLVELAQELVLLYGDLGIYLDYSALAAEIGRDQRRLAALEADAHYVRLKVTRPRYRQLHPSRNLETIKGIGQDGAAVYIGTIGDPRRFPNCRAFRGWSGLVPLSRQSGQSESKGLGITQAGPDLVEKYAYLNADTARQRDPQIAALYYDQMVRKGKHHSQAVFTCATHLLDRVPALLIEDRPYELREVDGTPITATQARTIVAERYAVPKEVRRQRSKRARREQAEQQGERNEQRRSRSK